MALTHSRPQFAGQRRAAGVVPSHNPRLVWRTTSQGNAPTAPGGHFLPIGK